MNIIISSFYPFNPVQTIIEKAFTLHIMESNQSTPQELWHYIVTMDTDMILTFAALFAAIGVIVYLKKKKKI